MSYLDVWDTERSRLLERIKELEQDLAEVWNIAQENGKAKYEAETDRDDFRSALKDLFEHTNKCAMENAQLKGDIAGLKEINMAMREALHAISLCAKNSMSSKEECGRIARAVLERFKK